MRHSNIAITMGYYANVNDAVMDAVLAGKRNTLRNTEATHDESGRNGFDVSADREMTTTPAGVTTVHP